MTFSNLPGDGTQTDPPPTPSPKKSPTRRVVIGGALAALLSAGAATTWALDRFVVEHAEITDVAAYEASHSSVIDTEASASTGVVGTNSFTSDQAKVSIKKVTTGSGSSTVTYFVADLQLTTATAVKSAFADNQFGENITATTSVMAESNNAIFAVNGDYYGFRDTGIVIRNGVAFRDKGAREALAFYQDGSVKVYDETSTNAKALIADGVWNTLSFGPSLLEKGAVKDGIDEVEVDTNFGNHSIQGLQPRTAVGLLENNHLIFVVVDGRSEGYSAGLTMTGLAQLMVDLGATTAYNIDGGGSSTMYFNGELVNNPLGRNQERGTSDILYISK